jgi:transposase
VYSAISYGALQAGDFYVVDNASIHGALDNFDDLLGLLNNAGVQLVYLPKYSPELNPCELVFNVLKSFLRNHRDYTTPLYWNVIKSLGQISREMMIKFYIKCLHIDNIIEKSNLVK